MASSAQILILVVFAMLAWGGHGQLSPNFYSVSCPSLQSIVRNVMIPTVQRNPRMGASLLRLFFHDCFVNVGINDKE